MRATGGRPERGRKTAGRLLAEAAQALQAAGADFLVLCTNTMHRVAPAIEAAVRIPLLHIADPTADAIRAAGCQTVGLLGTAFTMEQAFHKDRLRERHGLQVRVWLQVPDAATRVEVHRILCEALCLGRTEQASLACYRAAMAALVAQGAQAIILGCS